MTRNLGLQAEHTIQCSQSSVTHLRLYYQQYLQNSGLTARDQKYPVNNKFPIFDQHTKMIRFSQEQAASEC